MSAIIIRLYCMETAAVNGYVGIEYTVLDTEVLFVCVDSIECEAGGKRGESQIYVWSAHLFHKIELEHIHTRKIRDNGEFCVRLKQTKCGCSCRCCCCCCVFSSQRRWIAAMRQIHANNGQPKKKWRWTNELSRVHLMKAKVMLSEICVYCKFIYSIDA